MTNVIVVKEVVKKTTEVKSELLKKIRFMDGEVELAVKVFACGDDDVTTYDVEVQLLEDGEYVDCWVTETFHSEQDEDQAEKEALKRAKQVLRSVKGWLGFKVVESVEIYS